MWSCCDIDDTHIDDTDIDDTDIDDADGAKPKSEYYGLKDKILCFWIVKDNSSAENFNLC